MGAISTKWEAAVAALEDYQAQAEAFVAGSDLEDDPDGNSELPSTTGSGNMNTYNLQAANAAVRDAGGARAQLTERTRRALANQDL